MIKEVHTLTEKLLFDNGFERTEMKVNESARRLETYYTKGNTVVMFNGFFYTLKGQRVDFIEDVIEQHEKS